MICTQTPVDLYPSTCIICIPMRFVVHTHGYLICTQIALRCKVGDAVKHLCELYPYSYLICGQLHDPF